MSPTTSVQRAFLEIEGQEGKYIECWFNPKDYAISKTNKWDVKLRKGENVPTVQFGGGEARKLTLDLFFDASDSDSMDVVSVTNRLFQMMQSDRQFAGNKNKGRPPKVKFGWGSTLTFEAVAESLNVQFTHFRPDGTPVRAQAKLGLKQIDESVEMTGGGQHTRQNPTTTGIEGIRSHVVRDGDSLPSIAYAAYGDPTRWRAIANANGLDNPLRLERGAILSIPNLVE